MPYAKNTTVSPEKSRLEIESVVKKYGADAFQSGWADGKAMVQFRARKRVVRFTVDMPKDGQDGREERRRWRALLIVIKAKLEAVESKIVEFDSEFLAHIVMPNGSTVGELIRPQVALAYEGKNMTLGLPDYSGGES